MTKVTVDYLLNQVLMHKHNVTDIVGIPAGSTTQIQFNNAGALGADSNLVWDNTNKRLGIGITPSWSLDLNDSITDTTQDSYASKFQCTYAGGATTRRYNAARYILSYAGSGNSTTRPVAALAVTAYNNSTNTISNLNCLNTQVQSLKAGVTTLAAGGYFDVPSFTAGTITSLYGNYIANQGHASVTNAYGLYIVAQSGAGTKNVAAYFGSNTEHGTDTAKAYFGAGQDMTIWYDGTSGQIKTSDVAASDLTISCGTAKTLVLATSTYDDLQFVTSTGKVPSANYPTWEAFTTNTEMYAFSVDDKIQLEAKEPFHGWNEGTVGNAHIHFTIKTAQNTGSDRFVKFELIFAYADYNGIWTEQAALTQEQTIPTGSSALQNFLVSFATTVTLTGLHIGTQITCRARRITATGGTEYADDVYITQVGVHLEKVRIGSRSLSSA